jgi:hypothetical protein
LNFCSLIHKAAEQLKKALDPGRTIELAANFKKADHTFAGLAGYDLDRGGAGVEWP